MRRKFFIKDEVRLSFPLVDQEGNVYVDTNFKEKTIRELDFCPFEYHLQFSTQAEVMFYWAEAKINSSYAYDTPNIFRRGISFFPQTYSSKSNSFSMSYPLKKTIRIYRLKRLFNSLLRSSVFFVLSSCLPNLGYSRITVSLWRSTYFVEFITSL